MPGERSPSRTGMRRACLRVAAEGPRRELGHPRVLVHVRDLLAQRAQRLRLRRGVHDLHDDGNRRELAVAVGGGEHAVAHRVAHLPLGELVRLRAQHQVREVHVPRMRRNVRTLHHVAHVAEVALVRPRPRTSPSAPRPPRPIRPASTASKSVGNALHRLTHRRHPWQMSKMRSISARIFGSCRYSGFFQSTGWRVGASRLPSRVVMSKQSKWCRARPFVAVSCLAPFR